MRRKPSFSLSALYMQTLAILKTEKKLQTVRASCKILLTLGLDVHYEKQ